MTSPKGRVPNRDKRRRTPCKVFEGIMVLAAIKGVPLHSNRTSRTNARRCGDRLNNLASPAKGLRHDWVKTRTWKQGEQFRRRRAVNDLRS